MPVQSQHATIVFRNQGTIVEMVVKAGKQKGEVSAIVLHQDTVHHKKIRLKNVPSQDKDAIDPKSPVAWEEANAAGVQGITVEEDHKSGNSGKAVCFESPMGWYCIE